MLAAPQWAFGRNAQPQTVEARALVDLTVIKRLENRSRFAVSLLTTEGDKTGSGRRVEPGSVLELGAIDIPVPWAATRNDFEGHHLELRYDDAPRYWIWQSSNADGNFVRFSTRREWEDRAWPVDGLAEVDGDRTLVVMDSGFQLVWFPDEIVAFVRQYIDRRYVLKDMKPARRVPSVPKSTAVAFSIAGTKAAKDCIYTDSGKRYSFALLNGVVVASTVDEPAIRLVDAISYARKREGEPGPAPAFDLIAASQGRVFAKAKGVDRFFFAAMDETFVHRTPLGVINVPSTYFKLDPEYNKPNRRTADLVAHVDGMYWNHPAAERFPLFRTLFELEATDVMAVRVKPRVWYEVDVRPPLGQTALIRGLLEFFLGRIGAVAPPAERDLLARAIDEAMPAFEQDWAAKIKPPGVPSYPHTVYATADGRELALESVAFRRVLDIGVGHVHWHDQYQTVTGGELQPFIDDPDVASWYRFLNGPVRDGDGYLDGTCNYYALVELDDPPGTPTRFALLYFDEQSYFTHRWRLADPDDNGALPWGVVSKFQDVLQAHYWSPFRAGRIGPKSRLAVAAQVVLVTGAERPATRTKIYSTNFSYGSSDRWWRERDLPAGADVRYFAPKAVAAGTEPIEVVASKPASVYPETVRLREDMTIHVKGTASIDGVPVRGRWYQRYLDASNRLPERGEAFAHPWKFVCEPVYQLADRFSHFGVYDAVDTRTQYYEVDPVTARDAQALKESSSQRWVDRGMTLYRWSLKLPLAGPLELLDAFRFLPGRLDRRPPSLFNRETQLKLAWRGHKANGDDRWIAVHWDKRDDDLLPFGGAPLKGPMDFDPVEVTLTSETRQARVKLSSFRWLDDPPALARAELRWTGAKDSQATLLLRAPNGRTLDDVWKIRVAALDPRRPGEAVTLLNGDALRLHRAPGARDALFAWTPTADEAQKLNTYCVAGAAASFGTTVWIEDIVGHVGVPELPVVWPAGVAAFVRWEGVPRRLDVGQRVHIDVTMKNVGATAWARGRAIALRSLFDQWSVRQVALPKAVAPGGVVTFRLNAQAPNTKGIYRFGWQLSNGADLFGQPTPVVEISVGEDPRCVDLRDAIRRLDVEIAHLEEIRAKLDPTAADYREQFRELTNEIREKRGERDNLLTDANALGCVV